MSHFRQYNNRRDKEYYTKRRLLCRISFPILPFSQTSTSGTLNALKPPRFSLSSPPLPTPTPVSMIAATGAQVVRIRGRVVIAGTIIGLASKLVTASKKGSASQVGERGAWGLCTTKKQHALESIRYPPELSSWKAFPTSTDPRWEVSQVSGLWVPSARELFRWYKMQFPKPLLFVTNTAAFCHNWWIDGYKVAVRSHFRIRKIWKQEAPLGPGPGKLLHGYWSCSLSFRHQLWELSWVGNSSWAHFLECMNFLSLEMRWEWTQDIIKDAQDLGQMFSDFNVLINHLGVVWSGDSKILHCCQSPR